jgi:hypothetical protein
MAAEISFFDERYGDADGPVDVFKRPPLGVQSVAIGAAARSNAAPLKSRYARLTLSASCRILVYAPPEGTDNTVAVADGSDNKSEFFDKGEHVIGIAAGEKIAVIAAVSA